MYEQISNCRFVSLKEAWHTKQSYHKLPISSGAITVETPIIIDEKFQIDLILCTLWQDCEMKVRLQ